MNPPIHTLIAAVLREEPEIMTRLMREAWPTAPLNDDSQMIMRGLASVMRSTADGDANEGTRWTFLETVIPALISMKVPLREGISSSVAIGFVVSRGIAAKLPEDRRSEALMWLGDFFGKYVADVATTYLAEAPKS